MGGSADASHARRLQAIGSLAVAAILVAATTAHAQYLQRRSINTTGAVTFTGNTLGLSKATSANGPGTEDSIGTFITTNTALQDGTYPPGTTGDWRLDSSAATLQLPTGSTVVYAELVWGGSYSYGGEDVRPFLNTPVSLTTPAGTTAVSPDPATARQLGTPATNGRCNSGVPCFYVRSADVTALVQAGGPGGYAVGGVPATQGTGENSLNSAGWTLAVLYENFSLPVRNLSIFTGAEQSGAAPAQASGFCTPPTGQLAGRLAVSAIEGDASGVGDSMRFGATAPLPDAARLFGPNNPINNFFASQINDSSGALDTSGSFGTVNHRPSKNTIGGRQGWDVTNVDVSPQLRSAQTVAFAQGTTSGDVYVITTLGLQIDVGAPDLSGSTVAVDKAATVVGDTLTYTIVLPNSGTIDAANGVLTAPLPPGTALVPNSVTVDGVLQAGADPAAGVGLGSIAGAQTRTVTFQVTVNTIPPAPDPATYVLDPRFAYQFVSCAGQPVQSATFAPGTATTGIARLTATKTASPDPATPGTPLTYRVTVSNDGAAPAAGVTLTDPIPAGLTYVPGSTVLNATLVPDVAGTMPFAAGGLVSSPGAPAGQIDAGAAAIVAFDVTIPPDAVGSLGNTASIDPDGPGPLGPITAQVVSPLAPTADLTLTKSGPTTTTSNVNVTYTLVVTNTGPSDAAGVVLDDPTPSGLTFVSATGGCTGFPCTLGALAAGASRSIDVTFNIPNGYTTPDPIVNQASVSSLTTDPATANNTAAAATSLGAPVAVLSAAKSSGGSPLVPGTAATYIITVTNNGPNDSPGARITDVPPAGLTGVTWTCSVTAGGACTPASGSGTVDTTVNLPNGATATVTLSGTVAPDTTGALVNTATVENTPGVGGTSSLTATDTAEVAPQADVSVTKSVLEFQLDPDTRLVNAVYDIVVTNAGPSAAAGVTVSDIPDAVQTFTVNQGACTTPFPCDLGTIPPGESRIIRSRFSVAPDFTGGAVTNQARVTSATPDLNSGNDSSSVDAFPPRVADVAVEVFFQPDAALVGETVTVFVRVGNLGPATAPSVVVTAPLPAGLEFVEATPEVGTYDQATGEWLVGEMAADPATPRVLRITARVTQPGRIGMLATKTGADAFDPTVGNDSGGDVLNEEADLADVVVEKIATPAVASVGEVILTGIIVGNAGPGPATGIVVTDLPTPGLVPVGILPGFPTQGTYDEATKTWTVGDLAPEASAALAILVQVTDPAAQGNTARKEAQNEPDPNPLNDRDGAPVNDAGLFSEIAVTKAVSSERVRVGDQVTFTVKASNSALNSIATGVVLTDVLPPGLTFLSATPSAGTFDAGTLVWTLGDLFPNASETLAFRVRVDQPGVFVNTATRTGGSEPDITPNNDSATATVIASIGADLSMQKALGLETAVPGLPVTYALVVRNDGPSPAIAAPVTDVLPAVLQNVTWECAPGPGAACAQPSGTGDIATTVDVPAGSGVVFAITATLDPRATGLLENTATVAPPPDATDDDLTNNTFLARTSIVPEAELSVVKTGPTSAEPGATVAYTLTVSNAGPSTAVDVVADDPTPAGLAFVSTSGDCTTPFPCALGTLEPGGTRSIVATYTAVGALGSSVLNTAAVTSPTLDPTPENAASSVTTVVTTGATSTTSTTLPVTTSTLPPGGTTTTTPTTTTSTVTTTTSTVTTTTVPPAAEQCTNCQDDDADGLVDAEDPDCCAPAPLTVTSARYQAPKSRLRVSGTIAGDPFAGVDPRRDDVRLQIRNADGSLACCTLAPQRWQQLFGRTYGFFDQKMTACPNVKCVKLALPASGAERATIILGRTEPGTVASPVQFTLSVGEQCTQGAVSLRSTRKGGAVFP